MDEEKAVQIEETPVESTTSSTEPTIKLDTISDTVTNISNTNTLKDTSKTEEVLTNDEQITQDLLSAPNHTSVMNLLVKKDDVTWKTIILELVNSSRMDPWNIDITALTKEYLKVIKSMDGHDFRVSGKIILAAALLLKLKSSKLLESDLNLLDQLFSQTREEDDNDLGITDEVLPKAVMDMGKHELVPRTPMPRTRKISVYDLVNALEKALEVKERRLMRRMPSLEVELPKKRPDVTILMNHLLDKITMLNEGGKETILFTDLAPGTSKEEQVITFIPLLHLANMRHVDLEQETHFGPIEIVVTEKIKQNSDATASIPAP